MTEIEKKKISRESALDAAAIKKAEIDKMLSRLQQLSSDHFNLRPEAINWGHVGDLNQYAHLLRQIIDVAFREG